jgi:hypothetical protein
MSADQSANQTTARNTDERLFARQANAGETQLRRRIRELTTNLVHDIIAAISVASPADLGQRISLAEEAANRTPMRPNTMPKRRDRVGSRERRGELGAMSGTAAENAARQPPTLPPLPNDPFDITSPSELLASTDEPPRQGTLARPPPAEASHTDLPHPAESVTSLLDTSSDKEVSSERRPRVVLREGERLLSATGSGVVFRRERRVAPPR